MSTMQTATHRRSHAVRQGRILTLVAIGACLLAVFMLRDFEIALSWPFLVSGVVAVLSALLHTLSVDWTDRPSRILSTAALIVSLAASLLTVAGCVGPFVLGVMMYGWSGLA